MAKRKTYNQLLRMRRKSLISYVSKFVPSIRGVNLEGCPKCRYGKKTRAEILEMLPEKYIRGGNTTL